MPNGTTFGDKTGKGESADKAPCVGALVSEVVQSGERNNASLAHQIRNRYIECASDFAVMLRKDPIVILWCDGHVVNTQLWLPSYDRLKPSAWHMQLAALAHSAGHPCRCLRCLRMSVRHVQGRVGAASSGGPL